MELVLPLHTFDPTNVILDGSHIQTKSIVTCSYRDTTVNLSNMTLLFPITRVVSYHPTTGKLIIDMKDNVNLFLKLRALQDILIKYVEQNQGTLFRGSMKFSAEQIESQFQKLVNQNVIILYCPSSETGSTTSKPIIPVYKDGWNRTLLSTDIVNNADVRIIIKIVGLSFQMDSEKIWTGKFRLQHKIVAVFIT